MKDNNYSKYLLKLAERDLSALQGMVNDTKLFDDSVFGFHAQQAVEKSLKSLLNVHDVFFKKTHDLSELFAQIKENEITFPDKFVSLVDLTDYAVEYRYDLIFEEEPLNRKRYLEVIKELYEYILNKVSKEL